MQTSPPGRSIGWRAFPFIVVGAILLPFALAAAWLNLSVVRTDGYVGAVDAVVQEESVQRELVALVLRETDHAVTSLAATNPAVHELVDRAGGFDAVRAAIEQPLETLVASDAFARIWSELNRLAHDLAIDVLRGEGSLVSEDGRQVFAVNLARMVDELQIDPESAVGQILAEIPLEEMPDVELFTAPDIPAARRYLERSGTLALILGGATAVLLAAGIRLAGNRRRALLLTGVLVGVTTLAVAILLRTILADLLGGVGAEEEQALASAYVEALIAPLGTALLIAAAIGALVGASAVLSGRRVQPGKE